MKIKRLHSFQVSYKEAIEIQKRLRSLVIIEKSRGEFNLVAGCDVAYDKKNRRGYGAVVVMSLPALEQVEEVWADDEVNFPYIPGLLSFRELPCLLKAFEKLRKIPDVVMVDGQGIAHPRGLGIASHLGLCLDLPTIGCAKSRLMGTCEEMGEGAGSFSPLLHNGQEVGAVLRTKRATRPLFISPGHKIDLKSSIELVIKCNRGYRVPEPLRQAHILANRVRGK